MSGFLPLRCLRELQQVRFPQRALRWQMWFQRLSWLLRCRRSAFRRCPVGLAACQEYAAHYRCCDFFDIAVHIVSFLSLRYEHIIQQYQALINADGLKSGLIFDEARGGNVLYSSTTDKQLIPAKIRFNLILAGKEDKKTESRNSLFLFRTLNCLRVHRWWSRGELNPCPKTRPHDFLRVQSVF